MHVSMETIKRKSCDKFEVVHDDCDDFGSDARLQRRWRRRCMSGESSKRSSRGGNKSNVCGGEFILVEDDDSNDVDGGYAKVFAARGLKLNLDDNAGGVKEKNGGDVKIGDRAVAAGKEDSAFCKKGTGNGSVGGCMPYVGVEDHDVEIIGPSVPAEKDDFALCKQGLGNGSVRRRMQGVRVKDVKEIMGRTAPVVAAGKEQSALGKGGLDNGSVSKCMHGIDARDCNMEINGPADLAGTGTDDSVLYKEGLGNVSVRKSMRVEDVNVKINDSTVPAGTNDSGLRMEGLANGSVRTSMHIEDVNNVKINGSTVPAATNDSSLHKERLANGSVWKGMSVEDVNVKINGSTVPAGTNDSGLPKELLGNGSVRKRMYLEDINVKMNGSTVLAGTDDSGLRRQGLGNGSVRKRMCVEDVSVKINGSTVPAGINESGLRNGSVRKCMRVEDVNGKINGSTVLAGTNDSGLRRQGSGKGSVRKCMRVEDVNVKINGSTVPAGSSDLGLRRDGLDDSSQGVDDECLLHLDPKQFGNSVSAADSVPVGEALVCSNSSTDAMACADSDGIDPQLFGNSRSAADNVTVGETAVRNNCSVDATAGANSDEFDPQYSVFLDNVRSKGTAYILELCLEDDMSLVVEYGAEGNKKTTGGIARTQSRSRVEKEKTVPNKGTDCVKARGRKKKKAVAANLRKTGKCANNGSSVKESNLRKTRKRAKNAASVKESGSKPKKDGAATVCGKQREASESSMHGELGCKIKEEFKDETYEICHSLIKKNEKHVASIAPINVLEQTLKENEHCTLDPEVTIIDIGSVADKNCSPFVTSKAFLDEDSQFKDTHSHSHSRFKEKLLNILRKPYDDEEYRYLYREVSVLKPITSVRNLRGSTKIYPTGKLGLSYLDQHTDFRMLLEEAQGNKPKQLNLLRGFFCWMQNITNEGQFRPWLDSSCLEVPTRQA